MIAPTKAETKNKSRTINYSIEIVFVPKFGWKITKTVTGSSKAP